VNPRIIPLINAKPTRSSTNLPLFSLAPHVALCLLRLLHLFFLGIPPAITLPPILDAKNQEPAILAIAPTPRHRHLPIRHVLPRQNPPVRPLGKAPHRPKLRRRRLPQPQPHGLVLGLLRRQPVQAQVAGAPALLGLVPRARRGALARKGGEGAGLEGVAAVALAAVLEAEELVRVLGDAEVGAELRRHLGEGLGRGRGGVEGAGGGALGVAAVEVGGGRDGGAGKGRQEEEGEEPGMHFGFLANLGWPEQN